MKEGEAPLPGPSRGSGRSALRSIHWIDRSCFAGPGLTPEDQAAKRSVIGRRRRFGCVTAGGL